MKVKVLISKELKEKLDKLRVNNESLEEIIRRLCNDKL